MGKLDEISVAIGGLQEGMRNLQQDVAEIKERQEARDTLQNKRHKENTDNFAEVRTLIANGHGTSATLTTRQKLALASVGVAILSAVAWLVETIFGVFLTHVVSHFWKQ